MKTSDWYHVVATWDGNMTAIYVNNVLENRHLCDANAGNYGSDLFIASSDGADPETSFHGALDDLHIYHKALAPFEVRNLYRSATGWWGW
jgi:hypothetical protein